VVSQWPYIQDIAKISMPLSDQEDERNFYLDYKEIIDEMIEEKN